MPTNFLMTEKMAIETNDPFSEAQTTLCFVFESQKYAQSLDSDRYGNVDQAIFNYLMRLWAFLTLIPSDATGKMISNPNTQKSNEKDVKPYATITVDGGWDIHTRGNCISTSAGEKEHSFATTPFIKTAEKMATLLHNNGHKYVYMSGMDVGALAAWQVCQIHGIKVLNFTPSDQHLKQLSNLTKVASKTPSFHI